MVEETHRVLHLLGIDQHRLRLKWISASEGNIFAEEVRSFTRLLAEMGTAFHRRDAEDAEKTTFIR